MSYFNLDTNDQLMFLSSIRGNRNNGAIISKEIKFDNEMVGGNYWKLKQTGGTVRYATSATSLNGLSYYLGGTDNLATEFAEVNKFNNNTNYLTTVSSFSQPRNLHSSFNLNSYMYVHAGSYFTSPTTFYLQDLQLYNDSLDTWTNKTSSGLAKNAASSFVLNNFFYSHGGTIASLTNTPEFKEYNDSLDSWISRSETINRDSADGFALNGYGYSCNGSSTGSATKIVQRYDQVTNVWTYVCPTAFGKSLPSCVELNGFGYSAFGSSISTRKIMEKLNDSSNVWNTIQIDSFLASAYCKICNVNGFGYMGYGDGYDTSGSNSVYEFTPVNMYYLGSFKKSKKTPKKILVATNVDGNAVSLPIWIKTDSTAVSGWKYMESNVDSIVKQGYTLTHVNSLSATISANISGWYNYELCVGIPAVYSTSGANISASGPSDPDFSDFSYGGGYWAVKTGTTTARSGRASFSVNGFAHVCCGSGAGGLTNENFQYSDFSDTWTTRSSSGLTARTEATGFSLNGFGYVVGGTIVTANSALNQQYDQYTDVWSSKLSNTTARMALSSFTLNGFGYVTNGFTSAVTAIAERYNDSSNSWTSVQANTTASRNRAAVSCKGFALTLHGLTTAFINTIHLYNDAANTWTAKTAGGTARRYLTGFTLNNKAIICGGNTAATTMSRETNEYDIDTDVTTTKQPAGTARNLTAGFMLNNRGYHCSGGTLTYANYTNEVNSYIPNLTTPVYTITLNVIE